MINETRVVIIGGGIVGCSIAYHLGKMGWKDVVLLDKAGLTTGATWHAAGLVGQLRSSRNLTRLLAHSVELYDRLEEETGQHTGFSGCGSLRIAASEDRMRDLRRSATMANSFGLEMHLLSPKETQDLFPIVNLEGVVGSALIPSDGYCDPASVTQALAKGARNSGVTILQHTPVTGIKIENGKATEVHTEKGPIKTEFVVNAAGMWAREIGRLAGVNVPVCSMEHQYMVSEEIPGLPDNYPTIRDPDGLIYYKPEIKGIVMGGFEPDPIPWGVKGIPKGFTQQLLEPDYDQFEPLTTAAMHRTPVLEKTGVRKMINGPDGYTPDGNYILGRAPELQNFYVAAGMNCFGIAGGGGVGRALAEWIVEGEPGMDLWPLDIRRFTKHHSSMRFVVERSAEHYTRHYKLHFPGEEDTHARGVRRSPLYSTTKDLGAVFGEKAGWERPNWFAPDGVTPEDTLSFDFPNWFEHVGREHHGVRENVSIADLSSFSKMEVRGRDAFEVLQHLAANDLNRPAGSLTYTQMCNERGGIECDLTIARIAEDHFYLVTGSAFGPHDLDWIQGHIDPSKNAVVSDATSSHGVVGLSGPNARKVLEKVTEDDVSHEGFPFGTCKQISIGYAPVLALRITYVGELGWELHIPSEYTAHVFDTLWEAGKEFGMGLYGYRAVDTLRLEKGFRYWSGDITPDYNPYEAGLGFFVKLDKGDFIGREALAKAKEEGPRQKLCCFTIDEPIRLLGNETIRHKDEILGIVTTSGYGHSIGKTIAYGYLPVDQIGHDEYEIEAYCKTYTAQIHKGTLYDSKREKILR